MLHRLMEGLSRALPSQCALCAAWPAAPVCKACVARFAVPSPRCRRCALPLPADAGDCCGRCLRRGPALDACHAAVDYGYPWAGCITDFKFGGQPGWAASLAALVRADPAAVRLLDGADLVLPLPLAPGRLRERGFNQSLELARRLAPGRVESRLLLRVRETPAQSRLDRAARLANLRGAFAVDPLRRGHVRDRRIALVDDVMTSGASLEEAARALREAGAAHIAGIVVARTPEA
ncbi:MAG: ComF family protein [Burkholderiales bacterium]|jgi:ComF family protein|nr:ComF family protein [Burkholderiales bacterium]